MAADLQVEFSQFRRLCSVRHNSLPAVYLLGGIRRVVEAADWLTEHQKQGG